MIAPESAASISRTSRVDKSKIEPQIGFLKTRRNGKERDKRARFIEFSSYRERDRVALKIQETAYEHYIWLSFRAECYSFARRFFDSEVEDCRSFLFPSFRKFVDFILKAGRFSKN